MTMVSSLLTIGKMGETLIFVNIYETLSCGIQLDNFGKTLLVLCHKIGSEVKVAPLHSFIKEGRTFSYLIKTIVAQNYMYYN